MGEKIKYTGSEMMERWHQKMPPFFYWIVVAASIIGITAFTINTAVPALGGTLDDWWSEWYGRILSGCIATIVVCKFTVAGGYKEINPDDITSGRLRLDKDADGSPAKDDNT